jgi:hypothetical protein
MVDFPFLSCGGLIDDRGNILGLPPIEPRRIPKGGDFPITNGHGGGRVEYIHINIITRRAHTDT